VALRLQRAGARACHEGCFEAGRRHRQALFPWRQVVGDANNFGPKSVAIPGSVGRPRLALERFGTMDLADVIAPAIRLAEEGFPVDWYVTLTTAPYCRSWPRSRRPPAPTCGRPLRHRPASLAPADVLRQPDLGRSLRLIAKDGPAAFYRGAIAQAIDHEMKRTDASCARAICRYERAWSSRSP